MSHNGRVPTRVGPLEVRVTGEGPPALLWPSLFVDSASWQRVEVELARARRLVLISGPGHGASGDPGHRYTMADCADAAIEVLDELGIGDPVDWLGNAWGGHVGIIAATSRPTRMRSLIALSSPVQSSTPAEARRTRLLLALYRALGPTRFIRGGVADVLLAPATRRTDSEAVAYVHACLAGADRRSLCNAIESISLGRGDLTPLLARIAVPTLLATGADDTGLTPDQARAAAALVPGGEVAVIPDAAYLPPLEQPAATARLAGQSSSSSRALMYGSASPAWVAVAARPATAWSRSRASRSSSSMWPAFSGIASAMNSSVGVSRTPSLRPTSERSIPVAAFSASAVSARSFSSPSTV